MKILRLILGDQLTKNISSLHDIDKKQDVILMCEVWEEATYVRHHQKKIAFIFSAMRHFSKMLLKEKFNVVYIKLNQKNHETSFFSEVSKTAKKVKAEKLVVTHPGEYRVLNDIKTWEKKLKIPVEIRDDDRFLCGLKEFSDWANSKKILRMEYFYRMMRKKFNVLLKNKKPVGGKWNYDSQNRNPANLKLKIPKPLSFKPDAITKEVLALVGKKFGDHFGELKPFSFGVTRKQALKQLDDFIENRLSLFGDYQDAMIQGESFMYHAMISVYLNTGLLNPLECIKAAEKAYAKKQAPLNAVEAFIRQILGWREYIRGVYWLKMPSYKKSNYFNAKKSLPDFFWTGDTQMNCLKQCINQTKEYAYAHHIQRLMVLGNFTLLTGIDPADVNEWYLIVYADAFEWVELPNVTGMILFADGGFLASKPYAAGGAYINRMSNYCKNCHYKVTLKNGKQACPFNYLYWAFLFKNKKSLKDNPRLRMMYKTLEKMSAGQIKSIRHDANYFLKHLM